MRRISDEEVAFNPKTLYTVLGIIAIIVSFVFWLSNVSAAGEQNSKDNLIQTAQIELLRTQLFEMKTQLSVIQEQNKQLKTSLDEVKSDVKEIKNDAAFAG